MTANELRQAERRFQRRSALAEQAREQRNDLIRQAIRAGWTHGQVADATGLTRGRVNQIANQP